MDCKRARLMLPAYYDKCLDQGDMKSIELHLEVCSGCTSELNKINKLSDALGVISKAPLPYTLSRELIVAISRSRTRRLIAKAIRSSIIYRRDLLHHSAYALIYITIAISIICWIKFDAWHKLEPVYSSIHKKLVPAPKPKKKEWESLLRLPKDTKQKKEEPGAESLNIEVSKSSNVSGVEIVISNNRYTKDDVGDVVAKEVVLDFSSEYTIGQVAGTKDKLITDISSRAQELGENGATVKNIINSLLLKLNKPALPAYVEKAYFMKKRVWLIVLTWNTGSPSEYLSNVSVFAVDPQQGKIVYTE